jgi:hypothetical protein
MDFFRAAGDIWRQADRATGGWLPGGGTANPLSRPVSQAIQALSRPPVATVKPSPTTFTRIAGASPDSPALDPRGNLTKEGKEVLRQLGTDASVTNNIDETNPLAQIGAKHFGYFSAAHANPFKNQIYIPNSGLNRLSILAHEAAHLDESRRVGQRPPLEGVLGQSLNVPAEKVKYITGGELSPFAQLLAPFRIAGGALTAYSDAHEEDYAEKYTAEAMRALTGDTSGLGGVGHAGTPTSASQYSIGLHDVGTHAIQDGLVDLVASPAAKALAGATSAVIEAVKPKEKAKSVLNPGASKGRLQLLLVEADVDLAREMRENPNSRLIPRLKEIRDQYSSQLRAFE